MQENSELNPYVRRPGEGDDNGSGPVYREAKMPNSLARAASTTGIIAVVSIFTMLLYPAIILGATAIILALLSRDREGRMHDKAKSAVTSGVIALVADGAILVLVMTMLFSGGSFKQQLNDLFVETYGQTFDAMWDDARDGKLDLEYKFNTLGNNQLPDSSEIGYNKEGSTV